MPSPSFGQFFLLGLLIAAFFWTLAIAAVFLFAIAVFWGPVAVLFVVACGVLILTLGIITLANATGAGRAAKQASIARQRGL
jgi:hypothetical protein